MIVDVPNTIMNKANIEPGLKVNVGYKPMNYVKDTLTVRKIVETKFGVYAVFTNNTWRPVTTYNKTWWKA